MQWLVITGVFAAAVQFCCLNFVSYACGVMRKQRSRDKLGLSGALLLFSLGIILSTVHSVSAEVVRATPQSEEVGTKRSQPKSDIPRLSEVEHPQMSAQLLTQEPAPIPAKESEVVEIRGVKLNPTSKGLEVILETASGTLPQVLTSSYDNTFVANLINTQLTLPEGRSFRSDNPVAGITAVSVTQSTANSIRVTVRGKTGIPAVKLMPSSHGLVLGLTAPESDTAVELPSPSPAVPAQPPEESDVNAVNEQPVESVEGEEQIEIVVTGEREEGYRVPNATTGTRTDTPLRDIPQSIQVIPRQVIEDQQVIQLREATRNVSGVVEGSNFGNGGDAFLIRGFQPNNILLDGIELGSSNLGLNSSFRETANTQRVEVLKGPASVLYGTLEPGGIVNVVTEQPLAFPFYEVELQAGNFGLLRPSIDLSGPLNSDRTALYRLNAVYQTADDFRDFDQGIERVFAAPVLSLAITDNTDLILNFEYLYDERPFDRGLAAIGDGIADIPFDRILGEPDDINIREQYIAGYRLEHRFSENWQLRNAFRFISTERNTEAFQNRGDLNEETGDLARDVTDQNGILEGYTLQTNLVGEFSTGSIQHQLLLGIDLSRETNDFDNRSALEPSIINIFDPVYGASRPSRAELENENRSLFGGTLQALGIYLQDRITLADNLKLLVGGRFDIVDQDSFFTDISAGDILSDTSDWQQDEAFSPRVGIVYQPIEPFSLYASFSRSFAPNFGTTVEGDILEPTRGTQYEVGVRGELFEGRLTTNLAAYYLTKSNIAATDPDNEDFSIATGEQRSRGIELDVIGEILPGWNIIASYAYTDAEVTEDEGSPLEGNRLAGVPKHAASLWSTYEIQSGNLQGLGFGLGLFFVGERQGDLDNSFEVPSYIRTDASLFYRRDNWRAGINFRNLFDIDYIEAADTRSRITPGAPFTIIGSVSVEF
ncbi:TonB-dependent receptor [Chroococcidiopsis sp. CCMEE 29]|uniref:TonB-dependent receptor n=1 Tax=Chroococcidiopsis sp. CCMEE 29 TaxID=155894 RepID=UPI00201FB7C9|nr:TonB-dependent receptor [Chroococcidiopsis sp. CCMEE 29]